MSNPTEFGTNNLPDLLPCPFCGSTEDDIDHTPNCWFKFREIGASKYQMAQAWNRRAQPEGGLRATFPINILGGPMREYAPGKWESAVWPSEQPESEAPQAEKVPCDQCSGTGGVMMAGDCSDCNGKGFAWEPADTLSPLCGGQHAESGKDGELGCGGSGKCGVGDLPCLGCVNCPSEDDARQADAKRLMFAMQDIDGFVSVKQDKYDLAVVVMEERGLDEPDWECELEGVRRLIDKAMSAPSHTTNKEK